MTHLCLGVRKIWISRNNSVPLRHDRFLLQYDRRILRGRHGDNNTDGNCLCSRYHPDLVIWRFGTYCGLCDSWGILLVSWTLYSRQGMIQFLKTFFTNLLTGLVIIVVICIIAFLLMKLLIVFAKLVMILAAIAICAGIGLYFKR